ncbi:MAG: FKBP-type peptidyl-prolyl cis-trans isomerase [Chthonomonadaceae bacterium]|nr:FKBP-type peptidyl-prolyl cis-trans isomerase [Chthonomonadaceae bacterium]
MSTPPPNKIPRLLALAVGIIAIFLIFDYFHPILRQGDKIVTTPSGLQYTDLKVGTGPSPTPGHEVTVHYVGTLPDGSQFDSSRDRGQPFTFTIGRDQVIKGWDEGVMTMKVGGRRKLMIPSDLAYGERGMPDGRIPPNTPLDFDVELLGVK